MYLVVYVLRWLERKYGCETMKVKHFRLYPWQQISKSMLSQVEAIITKRRLWMMESAVVTASMYVLSDQ